MASLCALVLTFDSITALGLPSPAIFLQGPQKAELGLWYSQYDLSHLEVLVMLILPKFSVKGTLNTQYSSLFWDCPPVFEKYTLLYFNLLY